MKTRTQYHQMMGASAVGLETLVVGPGTSIEQEGLEEDQTGISRAGISESTAGLVDKDVEGIVTIATVTIFDIVGGKVCIKWFCSNSCLMCLLNQVQMLKTAASILRSILFVHHPHNTIRSASVLYKIRCDCSQL